MAKLSISDMVGFLGGDLKVVTTGPITGSNGAISTTGPTDLYGITVAPTVPSHCVLLHQTRLDNNAAAWSWIYTRLHLVSGAAPTFHLKTGNSEWSDIRSYYAGAVWNMNQAWDYYRLNAGTYQFNVQAQALNTTCIWTNSPENYAMALMWPQ